MSNDYSPDADDQVPEKKSSQQLLLLLLLLLVVLFAYLYFFTGLIKPREEQPKPQPVAEAPVKKPLPPRPETAGAQPAKTAPAQGEEHKAAPGAQAHPEKPGAAKETAATKPEAGKEAAGAKPAAHPKEAAPAKPAAGAKETATAKPAPGVQQAAQAKPAPSGKPAAPAAQAKPATAAAEKKPAAKLAGEPKPAAKEAAGAKTAAAGSANKAVAKPAAKPAVPAYALELKGDLAESEMGPVMAKLKQAGIGHVVKSKTHKGEPMHRLYLADFANRDEALEELERLKLAAPSAFLLKEGARYAVYAGSYLREAKASSEQNRLAAQGVQLVMKSATAPVEVLRVRAGGFADKAGAEQAAKKLQKAGLAATVVRIAQVAK